MRWPWLLATSLAAGLAANTIVAWSCAIFSVPVGTKQWVRDARDAPPPIQIDPPTKNSPPSNHIFLFTPELLLESASCSILLGIVDERLVVDSPLISRNYLLKRSAGWPMRSLIYDAVYWNLDVAPTATSGGITMPEWMTKRAVKTAGPCLPARPLPLGFAINTLFYASAALILLAGPRPLRRYIRRRRNRCPSCGYDRLGLTPATPCPECGPAPPTACSP